MPNITDIRGRIVFNSRGSKSIEVDVISNDKFIGRACAPSGASVGKYEAISFKENSPEKSLQELKNNLSKFIGIESQDPKSIYDVLKTIDGSIAYAVSVASLESASKALEIPLFRLIKDSGDYKFPFPLGNIIGGGSHAGPGTPDIQEYLVCPIGAKSIMEALEMNFKVHHETRKILETKDRKFTYGR
jgi:enolase